MEEQIKETISVFIKVPAAQIGVSTPIGRSAVNSSIMLHRMYARLAEQGVVVENYADIKVFVELLERINGSSQWAVGNGQQELGAGNDGQFSVANTPAQSRPGVSAEQGAIGIDMEEIGVMPVTNDFREDVFYKMNFSPAEIAYCQLQTNPYASFAGLFAVKEAIIKADNSYRGRPFNTIVIDHLPDGKPVHGGFRVSISHTGAFAIGVALQQSAGISSHAGINSQSGILDSRRDSFPFWLILFSLLLSAFAIIMALKR